MVVHFDKVYTELTVYCCDYYVTIMKINVNTDIHIPSIPNVLYTINNSYYKPWMKYGYSRYVGSQRPGIFTVDRQGVSKF